MFLFTPLLLEERVKESSYLADLRRRHNLTQEKLARKLGFPASYGQKKISQWEAGLTRPTEEYLGKLAHVLEVDYEVLVKRLSDGRSQSPLELFDRLSTSELPSLLAVCYSGRPRTLADSLVRAKYEAALKKNLYTAMFVPFAIPTAEAAPTSMLLLSGYFARVWGGVFASQERRREVLGAKELDKHIGIYGPRSSAKPDHLLIPPFVSRYSLLIEKGSDGGLTKSLYLAVETAETKTFQLIGTSEDENAAEQIQDWEAYFGPVVKVWVKETALPQRNCGYWQRLSGSQNEEN